MLVVLVKEVKMKNKYFTSLLAVPIESFWKYRQISKKASATTLEHLKNFDKFCINNYPKESKINRTIVNTWCKRRSQENNRSCNKRISFMRKFLQFLYRSEVIDYQINLPSLKCRPSVYIPHFFSLEELKIFFYKCDNYPAGNTYVTRYKALALPVFFRLLYSSGLRTCEARKLKVEDVDLNTGKIAVNNTKGTYNHYVVLHQSMLEIMREYHFCMQELLPERKYFFCFKQNQHYSKTWVSSTFRKIWDSCGFSHAIAYNLRHCYAITNINMQVKDMQEFSARFMCLSRSMGHSSVESTRQYYSLFPDYYPQIIALSKVTCDGIIPEVNDEESY
jgi:site-specific recombinase XerD